MNRVDTAEKKILNWKRPKIVFWTAAWRAKEIGNMEENQEKWRTD